MINFMLSKVEHEKKFKATDFIFMLNSTEHEINHALYKHDKINI